MRQHVRVHHAAAENLQPVLALAEADLVLAALALDVDFQRRLGERKERRAEAHVHIVHLEEGLAEFLQDPLQVAEVRGLVDHQALDLMEHRRVGLVAIAAIGAARADDADRRLLAQHGAHLHRRGVGAQQQARAVGLLREIEGVVHVPGRMAFREVQLGEVVVVGLDVGTFRHREAHVGEDGGELVDHLGDRMHAAGLGRRLAHRQGDVDGLGVEAGIERGGGKRVLARGDGGADAVLQAVDRRALAPCARPGSSSPASSAAPTPSRSCRARRRAPSPAPPRRWPRRRRRGFRCSSLRDVGHGDPRHISLWPRHGRACPGHPRLAEQRVRRGCPAQGRA